MLDEKGQPLHECGMAYMDRHSDNMNQRNLLETGLRPKTPKQKYRNDIEIVVRRLKRGGWRAYEAEYIGTYCQKIGGSVHVVTTMMRNHDGDPVQAPSLTSLLGMLTRLPFVEPGPVGCKSYKAMLAAMAANRY
jgi:hypothetical protein